MSSSLLNFSDNIHEFTKELSDLRQKDINKMAKFSLNKAILNANTFARREISKRTSLRQAKVTRNIRIFKASMAQRFAFLEIKTGAVPLHHFRHTYPSVRKRQLKVAGPRVTAWGKTKVYKGAFIPVGHEVIFRRTSKKSLPIEKLWGPNLKKVFNDPELRRNMEVLAFVAFNKEFERQIGLWKGKTAGFR